MKKFTGIVICIIAFNFAYTQQVPQYSQYLRNQFMVNPAAAGVYDFTDVTVSGRMQWLGLENAPMTSYASACAPLSKKPNLSHLPDLNFSIVRQKYKSLMTNKKFCCGVLAYTFMQMPMLCWIAISPVLICEQYHLSSVTYGFLQVPFFGFLMI